MEELVILPGQKVFSQDGMTFEVCTHGQPTAGTWVTLHNTNDGAIAFASRDELTLMTAGAFRDWLKWEPITRGKFLNRWQPQ